MAIAKLISRYCNGERNKDLALALVNDTQTPKEILEQLASSRDSEIAEAANLHVNLAGEIQGRWYELAENIIAQKDLGQDDLLIYELLEFTPVPDYFIKDWMPWEQIAKGIENPHIPVLWRERLIYRLFNNVPKAREWIAACKYTPVEILKQLAVSSDVQTRNIVSLQPSFTLEWFDPIRPQLKNDSQPLVDFSYFQWFDYPSTDITKNAILKLAAKNSDLEKRKLALKYGYACPDELFEILATDTEAEIRKGVALGWAANNSIREKLAQDEEEEVRKAIASCAKTPKYIREQLAQDRSQAVRQAVENNKSNLGEQEVLSCTTILKRLKEQSHSIKSIKVERNPENSQKLQLEILEKLADDRTYETSEYRSQLAVAIDTPTYILEKLISSPEIKIRYRLAKRDDLRWDLSDRLWEELVIDPNKDRIYNEQSREYNGNYIPVNLAEDPEALPFIIEHYAKSTNNFSRFIILSSPLLLPYLFVKYAKSKSWLDRYALAQNPATPKNILSILSKDSNTIVRAAAKENGNNNYNSSLLSKIVIPKSKIDNHNLYSTLTVITKQAARYRLGNDWHNKWEQEVILWELKNKQDLSFGNFMIYHKILSPISLNKFIQEFQKQASRIPIRKNSFILIEPPITEQSIDQCQALLEWLQHQCQDLQAYQINFHGQRNIFQIILGKTQDGNWLGIAPLIGKRQDNNHPSRQPLKLILINIDITPAIRVSSVYGGDEYGGGTVCEIANSKSCLIEKLLLSANFIEKTEEVQVNSFFGLNLTKIKSYKIGYSFSGTSHYQEIYDIFVTPQQDWLVLNSQIYSYP